ncbi:DUF3368 domain-containing protein [Ketobacter sp. MCCC 1A13808]|uniref:DUF3368 domain-containing protein n=1 Tax=Ketobacter sp. MCCC 1A13808 TaxID=2602738 RepID=UPI0012EC0BC0|nr:DUF3368 domain-containing protein [Ketobacter sp. MCCC 1A13808]MVF14806.1 DUF3368 domain-containing protein [Ketobacter sp. MCCC 1A13808]
MSLIVPDADPLIALSHVQLLDYLGTLFDRIVIPHAVWQEVCGNLTLPQAQNIQTAVDSGLITVNQTLLALQQSIQTAFPNLDPGETEVLALASADPNQTIVLIDDLAGRKAAKQLQLRLTGTAGIIIQAKQDGHIKQAVETLSQLRSLGYRFSDTVMLTVATACGETYP